MLQQALHRVQEEAATTNAAAAAAKCADTAAFLAARTAGKPDGEAAVMSRGRSSISVDALLACKLAGGQG